MSAGRQILDGGAIERALTRMAHELAEAMHGLDELCLVGIHSGGLPLARRLADEVGRIGGACPSVGEIDITLYRDDLYTGLERPVLGETRLPFQVSGATVVLVDDVLFTGRTIRAAMDELMDFGRPARIALAVLIDRVGHRELPIAAGYVGRRVETDKRDRVTVRLTELGAQEDGVYVEADPGVRR